MNIFDIIIIFIIVMAVAFAIKKIITDIKNGKLCSGNCRGCGLNCKNKK